MLFATVQVDSAAPVVVDAELTVYVEATPSATNETATAPVPANATVGVANAVVPGVIAVDLPEMVDEPPPLGVTVNSYCVPFVNPVTVQLCDPVGAVSAATVQPSTAVVKAEPMYELTAYEVAEPSAVNVTLIAPLPAFATVGVPRVVVGVIAADRPDAVDVVELPVGDTVNSYCVLFDSPVTVQLCEPVGGVVVFATRQVFPATEKLDPEYAVTV